ncbi:MAG: carboxypeptidase M32 [Pseudomonadota bacterium]
MKKTYKECLRRFKDITAISAAAGLASWDQETTMPSKAVGARAEQIAALAHVIHEKLVDPKLGRMLRALKRNKASLSADKRVCVREWLRDYEKATKLPADLVRELARVTALAQHAWIKAREQSNFKIFAPWLKKVVALKRKEAKALGYKHVPYDALLDNYEPDMTVAELDPIIKGLSQGLVPIVAAIKNSKKTPNTNFLTRRRYEEEGQELICCEVSKAIGVDANASRLDRSVHPFCCGLAPTDVRITTRYDERWLPQALYGVMHESGHALYEQGLDEMKYGTPLCESVSLGIHESQSRMWENFIGRGKPFVSYIFPRLKKLFPDQLCGVTRDDFYRAINRVSATPIRVEADEVTYNMHIVLRYELEKSLINGDIQVKDLPSLWNKNMKRLLGIVPKNDAEGVLQDTHWAQGMIGYFPTYSLGNLYAAQLWHTLRKNLKGVDAKIAKGDFSSILSWLHKNVHRHGRRYHPSQLIKRATGKALDPEYFLNYLREKYGEIYGIKRW